MTLADVMLDEELADTLADARRRNGRRVSERERGGERRAGSSRGSALTHRPSRSETALTRALLGRPSPPKLGVCCYCGGPAPGRTVCDAHSDLPQIDPTTGVQVTTATTGRNH